MNKETIKGNWMEIQGKIRQQWAKLTDDDFQAIQGNIEEIEGRLEKAYGYSKDRARREIDDFKKRNQL